MKIVNFENEWKIIAGGGVKLNPHKTWTIYKTGLGQVLGYSTLKSYNNNYIKYINLNILYGKYYIIFLKIIYYVT